jgi:hypothetical protein
MVSRRQKRLRKNGKSKKARRVGGALSDYIPSLPSFLRGDPCKAATEKTAAAKLAYENAKKVYDDAVAEQTASCGSQTVPDQAAAPVVPAAENPVTDALSGMKTSLTNLLPGSEPKAEKVEQGGGKNKRLGKSRVGKRR